MIVDKARLIEANLKLEKSKNVISNDINDSKNIMNYFYNQHLLNKLSMFDIFKISYLNNWKNHLCHGTSCCIELTSALFVLIYKKLVIKKLQNQPSFKINTGICYIGRENIISKNEGLKLQKEIEKINLRKLFKEIKLDDALKYIGVILYLINHQVEGGISLEKENKVITSFLIEGIKSIYSLSDENLEKLDNILYGREDIFLDWGNLSIIHQVLSR